MTGGDTKEKKSGAHGAMVQIPHRRGSVDTPHLFCLVEDGSNPGGDRDAPNNPNPLFGREREGERNRERERAEHSGKGTERSNRRERAGESKRDWEGESRRETHRAETGANRRKGRWWVRADQGGFELTRVKGTPRRHETVKK